MWWFLLQLIFIIPWVFLGAYDTVTGVNPSALTYGLIWGFGLAWLMTIIVVGLRDLFRSATRLYRKAKGLPPVDGLLPFEHKSEAIEGDRRALPNPSGLFYRS